MKGAAIDPDSLARPAKRLAQRQERPGSRLACGTPRFEREACYFKGIVSRHAAPQEYAQGNYQHKYIDAEVYAENSHSSRSRRKARLVHPGQHSSRQLTTLSFGLTLPPAFEAAPVASC